MQSDKPVVTAAFRVEVICYTTGAAERMHPTSVREVVGDGFDSDLQLQEEVDYTLKVTRAHDLEG